MEINVEINDEKRANLFLRALWAQLREDFSNYGWLYQPIKEGNANRIHFGNLDLGLEEGSLNVSIRYKTRGSIQSISFDGSHGKIKSKSQIGRQLDESVKAALNRIDLPKSYFLQTTFRNFHLPLANYSGENFSILFKNEKTSFITIKVTAFDIEDAKWICRKRVYDVLDALAVETNVPFWLSNSSIPTEATGDIPENVFVSDVDWLDGMPIENGHLVISREGKNLIDLIASGSESKKVRGIVSACRHFHSARKVDLQVNDQIIVHDAVMTSENEGYLLTEIRDPKIQTAWEIGTAHHETSTVLYMSALEVAASIGIENVEHCSKCGQPQYKIRRRVLDMVEKHLPRHIVKFYIDDSYAKRSKFLHEGTILTDRTYSGLTIPQLAKNSLSGCKETIQISTINLREFVSYCLRHEWKNINAQAG